MYPINRLGLAKQKENQFKTKGIETLEELVDYLPRLYHDLSEPKTTDELSDGVFEAVIGTPQVGKEGTNYMSFTCKDTKGHPFYVTFFGNKSFIKKQCPIGKTLLFAGRWKVSWNYGRRLVSIGNPPYCTPHIKETARIHPVYRKLHPQMSKDYLAECIQSALLTLDKFDYLERDLQVKWKVLSAHKAYRMVHLPTELEQLEPAHERLALDKLFHFAYEWHRLEPVVDKSTDILFPNLKETQDFMKALPFKLTKGQHTVLKNMMAGIQKGEKLKTLVQGDVGSGKTLVATIMLMVAAKNDYQAALLVPTQVLASQHAKEIKQWLEPYGLTVGYLSAELKGKERKALLKDIEDGAVDIVVGTHALLSDKVKFKQLGLVVVDEEHRFGVRQREKLQEQQSKGIHYLSMSATPIPRTLATTMYGDSMNVEIIDTLPAGRKPIQTQWLNTEEVSYDGLIRELKQGHQGYIICPLVVETASLDGVTSVEDVQKQLAAHPELSRYRFEVLHGKMSAEEVESVLWRFKAHEIDILIATTVVEVGVNVPNATHITILNADRFGLAQLHQLRGRVGRGSDASYCDLVSVNQTPQGAAKLKAMTDSTDGFYLSRVDLELRGAGNLIGDSQNGFESTFLLLLKYPELYEKIKAEMKDIYASPTRLAYYDRHFNRLAPVAMSS